jgi:hypothetical protein
MRDLAAVSITTRTTSDNRQPATGQGVRVTSDVAIDARPRAGLDASGCHTAGSFDSRATQQSMRDLALVSTCRTLIVMPSCVSTTP